MAITVRIDSDMCIASGYCLRSLPDVFHESPDGVAYVDEGYDADESRLDDLKTAAFECPAQAIEIHQE